MLRAPRRSAISGQPGPLQPQAALRGGQVHRGRYLSAKLIRKGSKARYDGKDGYQWHPRQRAYRKADRLNPDYNCATTSPTPTPTTPTSNPYEVRANQPVSATNPDLDCGDIPDAYKPIRITGTDYHRLDADGDGWGCEV